MFGMKKKVPAPVTKGVVKVPVVMQMEVLECGAASLTMIMHYYKYFVPLEQARVDCGVSMDGASAKNIMVAARNYGLKANAWRVEPEDLADEGPFPCMIHWGFNHFVVLCGQDDEGKIVICNPDLGRYRMSFATFSSFFTEICLFNGEPHDLPDGDVQ